MVTYIVCSNMGGIDPEKPHQVTSRKCVEISLENLYVDIGA